MNGTPNSERLHLGIFGRRNSGKSSLFNFLLGQDLSIVSKAPGTTTDPVKKAIELVGIGPCLLIDTAGIDDEGKLGQLRMEKSYQIINETDLAIVVFGTDSCLEEEELILLNELKQRRVPRFCVINSGLISDSEKIKKLEYELEHKTGEKGYILERFTDESRVAFLQEIKDKVPANFFARELFEGYQLEKKTVIAVMPQDKQAPKGRLILPQVSSLRELLDKKANVLCCVPENFASVIGLLKKGPDLVLADATALKDIKEYIPKGCPVTSFSAVFAAYKGDVGIYKKGADSIHDLKEGDRILISELCSHDPIEGDIGRVKIPNLLMKKLGLSLFFDICSGKDFPKDLSIYSLIIQCGACMSNRRTVMSRLRDAVLVGVPITNYGILIAKLQDISEIQ